jgi:hypothetical protein
MVYNFRRSQYGAGVLLRLHRLVLVYKRLFAPVETIFAGLYSKLLSRLNFLQIASFNSIYINWNKWE